MVHNTCVFALSLVACGMLFFMHCSSTTAPYHHWSRWLVHCTQPGPGQGTVEGHIRQQEPCQLRHQRHHLICAGHWDGLAECAAPCTRQCAIIRQVPTRYASCSIYTVPCGKVRHIIRAATLCSTAPLDVSLLAATAHASLHLNFASQVCHLILLNDTWY